MVRGAVAVRDRRDHHAARILPAQDHLPGAWPEPPARLEFPASPRPCGWWHGLPATALAELITAVGRGGCAGRAESHPRGRQSAGLVDQEPEAGPPGPAGAGLDTGVFDHPELGAAGSAVVAMPSTLRPSRDWAAGAAKAYLAGRCRAAAGRPGLAQEGRCVTRSSN